MLDVSDLAVPEHWRWFPESRYGLFIHWGPYAVYGRGEQVLARENIDHREYARVACAWNPRYYDAAAWADIVRRAGMKYAVLTTRHHDGYCLWDTAYTDYSSAQQAPKRDFVREYVDAFRQAGLRVGLYYSVADFRIPAYWNGPENDPAGFERLRRYFHEQVRELLTNYGPIDVMWFDKPEPHSALEWRTPELVEMMRRLQPNILVNQRLGSVPPASEGEDPVSLTPTESGGELRAIAREGASNSGLCSILVIRSDGSSRVYYGVHGPRTDSDLAAMSPDLRKYATDRLKFAEVSGWQELDELLRSERSAHEWHHWVALLLLAIFLSEMLMELRFV